MHEHDRLIIAIGFLICIIWLSVLFVTLWLTYGNRVTSD